MSKEKMAAVEETDQLTDAAQLSANTCVRGSYHG